MSLRVADYLDLLVADVEPQIQADDGLLDAMAANCPSQKGGGGTGRTVARADSTVARLLIRTAAGPTSAVQ